MTPTVSILIPVYNTEPYIADTIKSIIAQTYQDWELVIVDDCSQDNTYAICESFARKEDRIRLYRNEVNLGMMPNWNKGLTLCQGTYFGKLDADDLWLPTMIEDCVEILNRKPQVGLVCTDYQNMDEQGILIPGSEFKNPGFTQKEDFSLIDLVKQGPLYIFQSQLVRQGIGLMRRKIFDEIGLFSLLDAGDTEMWFRIACHYKIYFLPKSLHQHRVWSQSFTRTQVLKLDKSAQNIYEVRKAIFEYYFQLGKIGKKDFDNFERLNRFEYNKHLIYQYRKTGHYSPMLKKIIENLLISPNKLLSFYFSRFIAKFNRPS